MIPFYKMHANGNDFIIIDAFYHNIPLPSSATVKQWSDRHKGIGCDQLLYLTSSQSNEIEAICRIFNASGEEASQCGHGLACLSQFLYQKGYVETSFFRIQTVSGLVEIHRLDENRVSVYFNQPIVEPDLIPFSRKKADVLYPIKLVSSSCQAVATLESIQKAQYALLQHTKASHLLAYLFQKEVILAGVVSLGNPHCIVLVDHIDRVPSFILKQLSEYFDFPKGVNVGLVHLLSSRAIKLRTYERGVGENQACGSNAAAAVVISRLLGLVESVVNVRFPSDHCVAVSWPHDDKKVQLHTATHFVFEGKLY